MAVPESVKLAPSYGMMRFPEPLISPEILALPPEARRMKQSPVSSIGAVCVMALALKQTFVLFNLTVPVPKGLVAVPL